MRTELIEAGPSEGELKHLKARYGSPIIRHLERTDLSDLFLPPAAYAGCKGEGAVLILDKKNCFVLVKKPNEDSWFLPSGRIQAREDIEEGTIREALEETGLKVSLEKMPAIHIVDLHFKNCTLRLHHLIFVSRKYTGRMGAQDDREIEGCRFFSSPPERNREFEKEWLNAVLKDAGLR